MNANNISETFDCENKTFSSSASGGSVRPTALIDNGLLDQFSETNALTYNADTVDSVHAAFCAWLDRPHPPAIWRAGTWVLLDLIAVIENGPIPTLVQGLDQHVKQLEAAVRAVLTSDIPH